MKVVQPTSQMTGDEPFRLKPYVGSICHSFEHVNQQRKPISSSLEAARSAVPYSEYAGLPLIPSEEI